MRCGFNADTGSLIERVPICNLVKIKVVSVYSRLAPENPFPAAVEDVVAVYKEPLKTYQPSEHRNLRHLRGSDTDCRGGLATQAVRDTTTGCAGDVLDTSGLLTCNRLAAVVRTRRLFRNA